MCIQESDDVASVHPEQRLAQKERDWEEVANAQTRKAGISFSMHASTEQGTGRSTFTRQVPRGQFRHSRPQEYQDKSWCNGPFRPGRHWALTRSGFWGQRPWRRCRLWQITSSNAARRLLSINLVLREANSEAFASEMAAALRAVLIAKVPPSLRSPSLPLAWFGRGRKGGGGAPQQLLHW